MRKPILFAATALIALTLSACAAGPGGTGGGSSTSGTTGTPGASASTRPPLQTTTPGAIAPTGTPVEVPPDRWDAIVADLTDRGVTATPDQVMKELGKGMMDHGGMDMGPMRMGNTLMGATSPLLGGSTGLSGA